MIPQISYLSSFSIPRRSSILIFIVHFHYKKHQTKKTSIIASTLALTAAVCVCGTVVCAVRIANAVGCNMGQDSFQIFEISCFNKIGCLDFMWIYILSSKCSVTIASIRIHRSRQFLYAVCNYILLVMINQVTGIDIDSCAAKISLCVKTMLLSSFKLESKSSS